MMGHSHGIQQPMYLVFEKVYFLLHENYHKTSKQTSFAINMGVEVNEQLQTMV
jgi:hypothetical protein